MVYHAIMAPENRRLIVGHDKEPHNLMNVSHFSPLLLLVNIGDYSFDPLKLGSGGGAKLEKYKINELKNGRLAMMAFSGIITQAALNGGKGFPYF